MKQLLAIGVIALLMASCNQKHCWNCRIDYKNSVQFPDKDGKPGTGVKTQAVCDRTRKEMQQYEKDNSVTDAANNASVTYDCVKDYYK
ncbi:MAG: hypothetical protein JNL72_06630 [Flavipsychrobacter sp.]|nr:hypothetical protein [Flavipsychrobacter sp.]